MCRRGLSPAVEEGFLPRLEFVCAGRDRIGKLYELAAEGDLAQEEHEGIQPWWVEEEEERRQKQSSDSANLPPSKHSLQCPVARQGATEASTGEIMAEIYIYIYTVTL